MAEIQDRSHTELAGSIVPLLHQRRMIESPMGESSKPT
jgi:hypothetical protein